MKKTIGVASDHAGYEMKELLAGYLAASGYEIFDYGCSSPESCDYADYAHLLAKGIESGEIELGVGLCGSGEGMAMTLNKHQTIRAGLAWNTEIAELIKQHNNANVLVLPGRFITNDEALAILKAWLNAKFEGGRHERRIAKMTVQ
ncbi:MAG: RpiB/LacA/LacB family sugar-phosphate isomerase [Alistipes sp.]|nr:RpiB/LacA/LacB family sugar-phosphate isomerase [Alistipes sp.]